MSDDLITLLIISDDYDTCKAIGIISYKCELKSIIINEKCLQLYAKYFCKGYLKLISNNNNTIIIVLIILIIVTITIVLNKCISISINFLQYTPKLVNFP